MDDDLRRTLERDPRIAYALLFGSAARGQSHTSSDIDVAIGLAAGTTLDAHDVGSLISDLEHATGRAVDLLILDEAPPALAYRAFRDGQMILVRDHQALANRKARAILEYLDFQPVEQLVVRGAIAAAARGR
ncbi:MAG: type VII toxin-antitoxin system MntA family adenylyltransferase antitoxin [Vicinamibacterales bacterium]